MHEILVKRTIWIAKCPSCGDSAQKDENAPRERLCNQCKVWVPYVEASYTGPSLNPSNSGR